MAITAVLAGSVRTMAAGAADPVGRGMVVIDGSRIVAVGPSELLAQYPTAAVVDVGERTIVPGFIDAHNHLSLTALHPLWADLTGVTDLDRVRRELTVAAGHVASAAPDRWVRAAGWDDRRLPLTRDELDELEPERPLVVAHFSYHECVVNSRALDELGLSDTTPDPAGGLLGRFDDGRLTGRLIEKAWGQAHARSVAAYADPDRWADLIVERANLLRTEGLTAVHDPACSPSAEAVYRRLAAEGRLPISILALPHPESILADPDGGRLDGPPTGEGDEWFRVGPAKLFADGGTHPMMSGHIHGRPVRFGMGFESVADGIATVTARGFGAAVHTMGNMMLDTVLDAFDRADRSSAPGVGPFRIEHVTLAGPDHIRRMAAGGVVGVVQPGFVQLLGSLGANVPFDEARWMPFRSLLDAGVVLAGSSDDPCDVDAWRVLRSSQIGVSRRLTSGDVFDADERVGLDDWLRAYTVGSATAGGQLAERGTLRPGKRADLVVLDEPAGDESGDGQGGGHGQGHGHGPAVAQTWVAGRLVHDTIG